MTQSDDPFSSLHPEVLGLAAQLVGVAAVGGVACGIARMAWGGPVRNRLLPARRVLLGTLTGLPRWPLTAPQLLRGLGVRSFCLAGVQRTFRGSRPEMAASPCSGCASW